MSINILVAMNYVNYILSVLHYSSGIYTIGLIKFEKILAKHETVQICKHKNDNEIKEFIRVFGHFDVNFFYWIVKTDHFEVLVDF